MSADDLEQIKVQRDRLLADLEACKLERDRFHRTLNGYIDFTEGPIRSNVQNWRELQEQSYFENHPCYGGLKRFGNEARLAITQFVNLDKTMNVVVIGCGYGRDAIQIAPYVKHVWGIEVSETILKKARAFTAQNGISNFTGVTTDTYVSQIPGNIAVVFALVVMQHLTRDLVKDYISNLAKKLNAEGSMVIQFLEVVVDDVILGDAELRSYEPSVSWTVTQVYRLAETCGMKMKEIRTTEVAPHVLWHWVHLMPATPAPV